MSNKCPDNVRFPLLQALRELDAVYDSLPEWAQEYVAKAYKCVGEAAVNLGFLQAPLGEPVRAPYPTAIDVDLEAGCFGSGCPLGDPEALDCGHPAPAALAGLPAPADCPLRERPILVRAKEKP